MNKVQFIVQDLLSKVYQRHFADGKLPTQRELAAQYGVSRFTVQSAIKNLADIGVVDVVQGSGIYVRDQLRINPLVFNSLTRAPYSRIQSRCLSFEKSVASPEEKLVFDAGKRDGAVAFPLLSQDPEKAPELELWRFVRVRIVNGVAEQIETSCMPVHLFPDFSREVVERSIQGYVEARGYRISHFMTSYEPVSLTHEQAELLGSRRGRPAMHISNRGVLSTGRVFELSDIIALDYTVSYIRPYDREIHHSRLKTQGRS